jgi:hypothetical protein
VIGFRLDELPDGAAVSDAILKLGTLTCQAGTCPTDAIITATSLKSPVTSESRGSDLAADADPSTTPYTLPVTGPQADIAGSEYQWLLLTSNKDDEVITFAEAAAEQPSLALTYLPAGSPSKVLNLALQAGDASVLASWGLPESNGSIAMLDGYDVEIFNASGTAVKTLNVKDPYAAITGLINGEAYTVKVRAKTVFGTSDWQVATATPKSVPPPPTGDSAQPCLPFVDTSATATARATPSPESGAQAYIDRVKAYYQAQDAVLEGRATTIWDAPGVTALAPNTAKLSLLNTALVVERKSLQLLAAPRAGSTVALHNATVVPGSNGTVHVTVEVERTWEASASTRAVPQTAADSSPGHVPPGDFSISVHVFDRCGNIAVIQVPYATYEDRTDSADSCAGQIAGSLPPGTLKAASTSGCGAGGSGGGVSGGVCTNRFEHAEPSAAFVCEEPGFKTSQTLLRNEYTGTSKKRKGWGVTVDAGSSWWFMTDNDGLGQQVWDLAERRGYPVTDPGTFYNYVRVWPAEPKANSKEAKYIKRNLAMKSIGDACFLNNRYNAQIGGQLEIDGARSGSLGVSLSIQGAAEVACKTYTQSGPIKPSDPNPGEDFQLQPVWNKRRVKAECFQNELNYCSISAYRHTFRAEVKICYHINKTTTRCDPWATNDYYSWWQKINGKRYGDS